MKAIKTISALVILFAVGAYLLVSFTIINVPVGMVGVRTQEYAMFGKKGVVQEDFKAGWHRNLGPIDSWVLFDGTVQTLEMTRAPGRGDRQGRDDIRVRSADGNEVSVDVTVKFRIAAGKAHKVFQDRGPGDLYKTIVRNETEQTCMRLFGRMSTEDFYDPDARRKISKQALAALQKSLADNYVEVIDLLVRNVQFDSKYENSIREKKLADQRAEVNKSKEVSAREKGKTRMIEAETQRKMVVIQEERAAAVNVMQAETERKIAKIRADAEKYATEKNADADLIAAQKIAAGDLLVRTAEAEGERLRNQAMMGAGGSVIVALEAARNLNLVDITISTIDIDLLDIDKMATKLGMPPKKPSR